MCGTARLVVLFLAFVRSTEADGIPKDVLTSKWSYRIKYTGTASWGKLFKACNGQFQSPINIDTDAAYYWGSAPLTLIGYDDIPRTMYVENNGYGATLFPQMANMPRIQGGDLNGEYQLVQIHWHWGASSDEGSEHLINNNRYPMEIHFVHYNTRFSDINEALESNDHDALAVLGFMYEISNEDNGRLDSLIARLQHLKQSDGKVNFPKTGLFPMSALMDLTKSSPEYFNCAYKEFYRYEGSLTTPTCNEQVAWTVFSQTVKISERQMNAFRALTDKKGYSISNNYRPVQPLGKRILRKYTTLGGDPLGEMLNVVEADYVNHDHKTGHTIFYRKEYYARPEIRAILAEEIPPVKVPDKSREIQELKDKLLRCYASNGVDGLFREMVQVAPRKVYAAAQKPESAPVKIRRAQSSGPKPWWQAMWPNEASYNGCYGRRGRQGRQGRRCRSNGRNMRRIRVQRDTNFHPLQFQQGLQGNLTDQSIFNVTAW